MVGHHHHHHHEHGHGHSHPVLDASRGFAIGIALNAGFVIVEIIFGFSANSMALLADAGHNFSDVLGLAVAWAAAVLAQRPPSPRFTYGYRSSSILAALFNALIVMMGAGAMALESVQRLVTPAPVEGGTVMWVAAAGIVVNGATALLFMRGREADLNRRGAFLHMLADATVSAGVVLAGLATLLTGALWIDPAVGIAVVVVIAISTAGLLRESVVLSLSGVPAGIDAVRVRADLLAQPGVARLHDLHIWPMSTTEIAMTAHLVMPGGNSDPGFLAAVAAVMRERHGIHHTTLQIETDRDAVCVLEPDHVV